MAKSEDDSLKLKYSDENKPLTENKQINFSKEIKMVPPDGGWGWFIVLGSFLGAILATFPPFAFSILFSPILMSSNVSSTKIAWIYNLHSLIWSIYILFIGPLCDEFGWRKVAIFGGVANFISIFLSAFSPNADFLFFSFSVLGGIGGSSGLSLSFLIVARYFEKRRGFALGITTIGNVISIFLAPIVANYLLENYGYMGGSLIFSAIVLNQCVGGALYHPVEWHMIPEEIDPISENILNEEILNSSHKSKEDLYPDIKTISLIQDARKMSAVSNLSAEEVFAVILSKPSLSTEMKEGKNDDYDNKSKNVNRGSKFINVLKITYENTKSLKYMRVHLISWAYCGLMLGYINFQMFIPFAITNAGYSLEMAAWCSSVASVGNIIGRVVMSVFSDRKFFNVNYGFAFGLLLMGISIIVFSLVKDIKFYVISTCCWGIGVGSAMSLHVTAMISVMGVEMLPAVLGVASLFKGFGGITIGTLTGVVRDATSSYMYALWMLGIAALVAFCLWLLIPCAEKFDKKKCVSDQKNQDFQKC